MRLLLVLPLTAASVRVYQTNSAGDEVNVIDPANLPEKKSWPPRLLIIVLLTVLSLAGAVGWIVGCAHWEHVYPQNPGKMFAESVWKTASDRGTVLLNRLAILRRRNKSSDHHSL